MKISDHIIKIPTNFYIFIAIILIFKARVEICWSPRTFQQRCPPWAECSVKYDKSDSPSSQQNVAKKPDLALS